MSTQALAQSLPGTQVSRVVLLLAEERAQSLALPPPPPATPSTQVSEDPFAPFHRRMLSMQLQLMELHRAPLGGPLSLTIIGGSALVLGGAMLLLSAAIGFVAVIGVVMVLGSLLPLLVGIPWLISNVGANNKLDLEMDKVRTELRRFGDLSAQRFEPSEGALLAQF